MRVCRPETCILFDLRTGPTPRAAVPTPLPYPQLLEQIRALVPREIPPDATVLVVSKGDSQLLDLGRLRAWHFPQNERRDYLGHHPADSAAAMAHL